jgi:nucleoside-diphosphate-sugar epimerase
MSILVTGGTGLIGSYLTQALVEEGYTPILFDRNPDTRLVSNVLDKIKIVRGDVTSLPALVETAKKYGVTDIFHLAAILSIGSEDNPILAFNINSVGTINALETARIFDVNKFIFPSTSCVYDPALKHPVEGSPEKPRLIYGVTKVTCEQWCLYYQRRYGLEVRGTRYISIIGPGRKDGGASRVTSIMIEKAALGQPYGIYADRDIRIPILYIKDAVDVLLKIFKAEEMKSRFYNIGGIEPTVGEIYDKVKSILPEADLTFKPDPKMIKILRGWPSNLDSTRVKRELGWQITYDLDHMVEDFIKTVQSNKEMYT